MGILEKQVNALTRLCVAEVMARLPCNACALRRARRLCSKWKSPMMRCRVAA